MCRNVSTGVNYAVYTIQYMHGDVIKKLGRKQAVLQVEASSADLLPVSTLNQSNVYAQLRFYI